MLTSLAARSFMKTTATAVRLNKSLYMNMRYFATIRYALLEIWSYDFSKFTPDHEWIEYNTDTKVSH